MSAQENKALVRRVVEALNARSFALVNEFIAPNFVDHSPIPGQTPGAKAMMQARINK